MQRAIYILLLILLANQLGATDYYCDPVKGNNSNNGSISQPWKTLQEVFESKKVLTGGDIIYLLNGNHGKVMPEGIMDKYVTIQAYEDHKPSISTLIIGEKTPTMRWRISGITLGGPVDIELPVVTISGQTKLIQILYCTISTDERTVNRSREAWENNTRDAMKIGGEKHKILFNRIRNVNNGIVNSSNQSQFQFNSINFFCGNGIQTNGNNNLFENNLIKNSINLSKNSTAAFIFTSVQQTGQPSIIKQNILRGNSIYNYTRHDREFLGSIMGIVSFDNILDMCTFESNMVVCDHWHGLSLYNINNCTVLNNSIIDPYLGTIYTEEKRKEYLVPLGPARLWLENKIEGLGGNNVCNNLVSASVFKNVAGRIENNPVVGSSYEEMDETFLNWEFLDFRLKPLSPFVNAGLPEISPKSDAGGMLRNPENMINAGAYEYSKDASLERNLILHAEKTDIELQSNAVKNWNGQTYIRLGGAGDVFNSNAIIPFILPATKPNEKVTQATFTVQLDLIQNNPSGSVDLYGLLPRDGNEIHFSDYYEGESGKATLARLIQAGIFDGNNSKGNIRTNKTGGVNLADYINSLYDAGYKAGDQFFIRLNHNKANIAKYSRWQIASANAENAEIRPKIELQISSKSLFDTKQPELKPTVYINPSPSIYGDYKISILNNSNNELISLSIKKPDGSICYTLNKVEVNAELKMTSKYNLPAGQYLLNYRFGDSEEKLLNFYVW